MISPEFRITISEKNLLRTRIMLKDSFVVDPTFIQFDEMLSYAETNLPDLLIPFDGTTLEEDVSKWDNDLMNEELVQLVNNFSYTRINHLKKVVAKVLESEAEQIRSKRNKQIRQQFSSGQSTQNSSYKSSDSRATYPPSKGSAQLDALKVIKSEAQKIKMVMTEVKSRGTWKSTNINDIEQAAIAIIKATKAIDKEDYYGSNK